nr:MULTISPECIES: hypothetical protein [Providencia]
MSTTHDNRFTGWCGGGSASLAVFCRTVARLAVFGRSKVSPLNDKTVIQ